MIINIKVSLEELAREGRAYRWDRPDRCPNNCGGKIWGHGFAHRYFRNITNAIPLKRWRCSNCGIIIQYRPDGFWRRFQDCSSKIYNSILTRLSGRRWPPDIPRQRGGYWLSKFTEYAVLHEMIIEDDLTKSVLYFIEKEFCFI
jgi:hypothetical protein